MLLAAALFDSHNGGNEGTGSVGGELSPVPDSTVKIFALFSKFIFKNFSFCKIAVNLI
jgi:hypothetical protein